MIERYKYVSAPTDPDPGGPKTYGSGSATLIESLTTVGHKATYLYCVLIKKEHSQLSRHIKLGLRNSMLPLE
jgi:hypothetical protein